jgi:hypothetical protein
VLSSGGAAQTSEMEQRLLRLQALVVAESRSGGPQDPDGQARISELVTDGLARANELERRAIELRRRLQN